MDIKQNVQPAGGVTSQQKKANEEFLVSQLLVRTMEKDMAALSKNSPLVSLSPAGIPIAKPTAPAMSQPYSPPKIVVPPAMDATKKIIPPPDLPVAKTGIKSVAPTIPLTLKPAPAPPPPPPPPAPPPSPALKPPEQKPLPPRPTPPILPITEMPEPDRKLAWGKIALIAGLLVIVALSVGGWIYWKNIKPEPTVSATPSSTPTPLVLPSPLFNMDEQREIELANAQKTDLNEITQIFSPLKEESAFAQIIFETSANGQKKIPTLSELSALTGFESFALSLTDYLQPEKYSFFIYNQTNQTATSSSPFSGGQRGRLGFVVALQDTKTTTELSQKLKELEPTIPTNLKDLLADKSVSLPDTISFLDNTYKNTPIRYINFPTAALSIDYAVVNGTLVIATSKESMYAAVDRLLNIATSSMADWQTYRNEEYGFELKYPKDWQRVIEHNPPYPKEGVLYLKSIEFNKDTNGETGFNVETYDKNKVMDYNGIDNGIGMALKAEVTNLESCAQPSERVTVGVENFPAKLIYSSPRDECFKETYFYYLQKGNYDYFITPRPAGGIGYVGYDGKIETKNSLPQFNQILSTFKFTK